MAWNKNTLDTKVNPGVGQIREIHPPIFLALIHMRFENKAIDTIRCPRKPL
jgi:hypothetical protein